jgi:hypothetical protein
MSDISDVETTAGYNNMIWSSDLDHALRRFFDLGKIFLFSFYKFQV